MTARERLPNRRASTTFELDVGNLHYTCSFSCFADGRVGELFLSNTKAGSQSDANARDSAVAASFALQFGCPVETLRCAVLRNSDGTAATPLGAALDVISKEGRLP
jgi:hypothetical protein